MSERLDSSATATPPVEPLSAASPGGLTEAPPVAEPQPVSPATQRQVVRVWCAGLLVLCLALLGTGLYLHPDPAGHGTHQQLGLPPCGFYLYFHIPCPTCGCTTAVSLVAHGRWIDAWTTQPFGAVVGFLALACLPLAGMGVIRGQWYGPKMFTLQWYWKQLLWGGGALLAGAWGYRILLSMR